MLELTTEQAAALAEIDARRFVSGVRDDLVRADPRLADDPALPSRLWRAYLAARALGIHKDENLVAFLRVEAYAPSFFENPATRAWLTRPGRSADERFYDYLRVMRWKIEHPEFVGGLTHGGTIRTSGGIGSGVAWTGPGAWWRSLIGRGDGSGNG
jgi:hypothetical protein